MSFNWNVWWLWIQKKTFGDLLKWFPEMEVEICFIFRETQWLFTTFYAFNSRVQKLVGWEPLHPKFLLKSVSKKTQQNILLGTVYVLLLILLLLMLVDHPYPAKNSPLEIWTTEALLVDPSTKQRILAPWFSGVVGHFDWYIYGHLLPELFFCFLKQIYAPQHKKPNIIMR